MELHELELELAAVSASLAAGCHDCTEFHLRKCRELSVSPADMRAAVRHGASIAQSALRQLWSQHDPDAAQPGATMTGPRDGRQSVLCRIGAAVAVNSVQLLQQQVDRARSIGIRDCEVMEIAGLARSIKAKAASHLEPVLDGLDASREVAENGAKLCS